MEAVQPLFLAAVTALAIAEWRRDPEHRWLALYLGFLLVHSLAGLAIDPYLAAAVEVTPSVRAAFHLSELATLLWSFGLLACVAHYFLGRFGGLALAATAIPFALCLDYESVNGETLANLYRVVGWGHILLSSGIIAFAIVRTKRAPRVAHLVLLLLVVGDVVLYALPLAAPSFTEEWDAAVFGNAFVQLVVAGVYVRHLFSRADDH